MISLLNLSTFNFLSLSNVKPEEWPILKNILKTIKHKLISDIVIFFTDVNDVHRIRVIDHDFGNEIYKNSMFGMGHVQT